MVAMTRALAVQGLAGTQGVRRRFIPALPTLWPGMLSPLAAGRPPIFPLAAPRVTRFYFARNAVFHAVKLLGLEGREVLVPAYHHGVEISALLAAGAVPRFVRVDARMRLDLEDLEAKVSARTAAIYVIHYAGFPQPVDDLAEIARRAGVPLLEDCALSLLSADGTRPLGSTGTIGIFCFYKALPVPNGGALVVNDPDLQLALPAPGAAPMARRSRTPPARSSPTPPSAWARSARRSGPVRAAWCGPCAAPPAFAPSRPAPAPSTRARSGSG